MSKILAPLSRQRFFDNTGLPLAGGQVFTYIAGSSTPLVTYSNQGGTTNTNPVVLDPYGYADIWLDPSLVYKFVLEDSSNNILWTEDNISVAPSYPIETASSALMGPSFGSASAGPTFRQPVPNDLLSTFQAKTTTYSILGTDDFVTGDASGAGFTFTLPAANSVPAGKSLTVMKIDSSANLVTIARAGSDTIGHGLTSVKVGLQYDSIRFISDGSSKWYIAKLSAIAMSVNGSPSGSLSTSPTTIVYGASPLFDSWSGYSNSTGAFTVPVDTVLNVQAGYRISYSSSGGYMAIHIYVNSSEKISIIKEIATSVNDGISIGALVQCSIGDTITIKSETNVSSPAYDNSNTSMNYLCISNVMY